MVETTSDIPAIFRNRPASQCPASARFYEELDRIPGVYALAIAKWPRGFLQVASPSSCDLSELLATIRGRRRRHGSSELPHQNLTPHERRASAETVAAMVAEAKRDQNFTFAILWRIDGETKPHLEHSDNVTAKFAEVAMEIASCGVNMENFDWTNSEGLVAE